MGLMDRLLASGVKTYEASPLWRLDSVMEIIELPSANAELVAGDYGVALLYKEGNRSAYLPVMNMKEIGDVVPSRIAPRRAQVGSYVAVRDYPDGDVYEGDVSTRVEILPEEAL